jgi:hypothetical protein
MPRRATFPLAILLFLLLPLMASAQGGEHRAAMVVRYADGQVQKRCVSFSEASLTGAQLLQRSGLQVIVNPNGSFGGAVCSIDKVGCDFPAKDCFCQCMGAQCEYWAYYHLAGSGSAAAWQYSQIGAGAYQVQDGAVEGWSWGTGDFSKGTEPPKFTFGEVCDAAKNLANAASPGPRPANLTQYAAFGGAILVLAGVAAVVLRRRT